MKEYFEKKFGQGTAFDLDYGKHGGILLLQLFYASAGIIGMVRWF